MWMPKRNETFYLDRYPSLMLRLAFCIFVGGFAASEAWAKDQAAGARRSKPGAPDVSLDAESGKEGEADREDDRDRVRPVVLRRRLRHAIRRRVGKSIAASELKGFVAEVYDQVGIDLPEGVPALRAAGRPVEPGMRQLGDALFFGPSGKAATAVALYDGRGNIVFPARTSFDDGRFTVHRQPVEGWFKDNFIEARRYVPELLPDSEKVPEVEIEDDPEDRPGDQVAGLPGKAGPGSQPGAPGGLPGDQGGGALGGGALGGGAPGGGGQGGGNPLGDLFSSLLGGDEPGGGGGCAPGGGGGFGEPGGGFDQGAPVEPDSAAPNLQPVDPNEPPMTPDPFAQTAPTKDEDPEAGGDGDEKDDDEKDDEKSSKGPVGDAIVAAGDAVADAVTGAAGLLADIFDVPFEPSKGTEASGGSSGAAGDKAGSGQAAGNKPGKVAQGKPSDAGDAEAASRANAEAEARRAAAVRAWQKGREAAYRETEERIRMAENRERSSIRNAEQARKDAGWFGSLSRGATGADPYQAEVDLASQKLGILSTARQFVGESRRGTGSKNQIDQLNKARRLVGIKEVDSATGRISTQPSKTFGVNRLDIRR